MQSAPLLLSFRTKEKVPIRTAEFPLRLSLRDQNSGPNIPAEDLEKQRWTDVQIAGVTLFTFDINPSQQRGRGLLTDSLIFRTVLVGVLL